MSRLHMADGFDWMVGSLVSMSQRYPCVKALSTWLEWDAVISAQSEGFLSGH